MRLKQLYYRVKSFIQYYSRFAFKFFLSLRKKSPKELYYLAKFYIKNYSRMAFKYFLSLFFEDSPRFEALLEFLMFIELILALGIILRDFYF